MAANNGISVYMHSCVGSCVLKSCDFGECIYNMFYVPDKSELVINGASWCLIFFKLFLKLGRYLVFLSFCGVDILKLYAFKRLIVFEIFVCLLFFFLRHLSLLGWPQSNVSHALASPKCWVSGMSNHAHQAVCMVLCKQHGLVWFCGSQLWKSLLSTWTCEPLLHEIITDMFVFKSALASFSSASPWSPFIVSWVV